MNFAVHRLFSEVFGLFNLITWPVQLIAYLTGIAAVIFALRPTEQRGRNVAIILAMAWLWIGGAYLILIVLRLASTGSPEEFILSALFILQGILLFVYGTALGRLRFGFAVNTIPMIGTGFIIYALVLHSLFGGIFARCTIFGVAPCPVTVFTFGLMLWASRPFPLFLVIVPLLWSLLTLLPSGNSSMPSDPVVGLAGILGTILVIVRNRQLKQELQNK